DRSSTSNLKKHAETCWGKVVVKARLTGGVSSSPRDGNIFASFARTGQRPVKVLHRAHTEPEFRAYIVRWLAEANRPFRIMEDRELRELLLAGRPEHTIPSRRSISRDLNAAFDLFFTQNYNGRLSFATDAWTSPNHRAFVAWTVHLQHEGQPLVFLLDVFEVPEVPQGMFLRLDYDEYYSTHSHFQILAWAGDNATVNDTQNTALGNSAHNTFRPENHVRCFTHTLNLGVKSFLRPFQPPVKKKGRAAMDDDDADVDDGDMDSEVSLELEDDESLPDLADVSDTESMVDEEDHDAWDQMDEAGKADMLAQTKAAKSVISRVRFSTRLQL
ncbi:hypothetical protein B0H14DRAFT_2401615, partial [Mycena olivaceomarginata]